MNIDKARKITAIGGIGCLISLCGIVTLEFNRLNHLSLRSIFDVTFILCAFSVILAGWMKDIA